MLFLDTDILIDLTKTPPREEAVRFSDTLTEAPAIPYIVSSELLQGAKNNEERKQFKKLLDRTEIVYHSQEDQILATTILNKFLLPNGVGAADALIAATTINRGATLYTLNDKHFRAIASFGLSYVVPYVKEQLVIQEKDKLSVSFIRWDEDKEGIYGIVRITEKRHERYFIEGVQRVDELTQEDSDQLVKKVREEEKERQNEQRQRLEESQGTISQEIKGHTYKR